MAIIIHPDTILDRLLTRKEAADLLGVSVQTIHLWRKTGRLVAVQYGQRYYYRESDCKAIQESVKA